MVKDTYLINLSLLAIWTYCFFSIFFLGSESGYLILANLLAFFAWVLTQTSRRAVVSGSYQTLRSHLLIRSVLILLLGIVLVDWYFQTYYVRGLLMEIIQLFT